MRRPVRIRDLVTSRRHLVDRLGHCELDAPRAACWSAAQNVVQQLIRLVVWIVQVRQNITNRRSSLSNLSVAVCMADTWHFSGLDTGRRLC